MQTSPKPSPKHIQLLSGDLAQQFCFQDILAFLVFLLGFISLVVLPAHDLLALSARDVTNLVLASGHEAFNGIRWDNVDNRVEEEGFAVLSPEVLLNRTVSAADLV